MFDIWKSVISGNLTDDPALRKSKEGRDYITFSVAVNIDTDVTNYFSVYCFEKRHMDFATAFLQKGSGVVIVGSVQQRKAQSGDKTYLKMVPTDICMKASSRLGSPASKDDEVNGYEESYL